MVFLDSTVVNLMLPTLHNQLGGGRADVEWVLNSYTISFASVLLLAGSLSDTLGVRGVFLAGLVTFGLASTACAFAGDMRQLIGARLLQGVGAALMLPSSLKLVLTYADGARNRARTVSLWSAGGGVGLGMGPLAGGVILALASWRWVFLINTVVTVVAVIVTISRTRSVARIVHKIDLKGQTAATVAIGGLVFALVEGPYLGWYYPYVITAISCFVFGSVSFIILERRTPEPILPLRLLKVFDFTGTAALGLLLNFSFYGLLFTLSFLLQDVRHETAFMAGLSFLPLTGVIVFGVLSAPSLANRYSSNLVLFLGQGLFGIALLNSVFLATMTDSWPMMLALMPAGFGAGMLVPTITSRLLESAPIHLAGAASGAFQVVRQVGSAVGVAIFGAVLASASNVTSGFQRCMTLATLAVLLSAILTYITLKYRKPESSHA